MKKDKKENGSWFEVAKTFAWALILASIFRTFAFDPYHIPSGSMLPNLLIGDFVIVSKYSYGYSKYSSWPVSLPLFDGRIAYTAPERGDIAVFKVPQNTPDKQIYVKRIIGLPGDTIQVLGGKLKINGEFVKAEKTDTWLNGKDLYTVINETLDNGKSFIALDEGSGYPLDNTIEFKVPDDSLFMMGDNRDNSEDSRASLGFVPIENLIGRAEIVLFSSEGVLWNPLEWRLDRFFTSLRK